MPNAAIDPLGLPWAKDLPFNGVDDPANELGFADDQTPPVVDFRESGYHGIVLISNRLRFQDALTTLNRRRFRLQR